MFQCCLDLFSSKTKDEDKETGFVSSVILPEPDTFMPNAAWDRIKDDQIQSFLIPMNHKSTIHRDKIRFVCISDTHTQIEKLTNFIPSGDVLLHAGNFTNTGQPEEIKQFNDFIGTLPHKCKIVIAGNQDLTFDDSMWNDEERMEQSFNLTMQTVKHVLEEENVFTIKGLLSNCIYLEDSLVNVCGLHIYGSPWIPEYCNSAFNLKRGGELLQKWNNIPDKTDIIVSHGPPLGYGDLTISKTHVGCLELLNTVQRRVKPKYHVFGHVREGYGIISDGFTTFVNSSTCTFSYTPSNAPVVFDLSIPKGHSKDELLELTATK
ncbi:metallophosphoesterase MPPED2-like [Mytilus edulis]